MKSLESFGSKIKEFGPTTWSIKNKTSIYLVMLFITLAGVSLFVTLHKNPVRIFYHHNSIIYNNPQAKK